MACAPLKKLIKWDRVMAKRSRTAWAKQFGPGKRTDWFVMVCAALFEIWLWASPTGTVFPGYGIGALGVVAFVMTFRRPTAVQKGFVIVLAVSLYALEMHLIKADHDAQRQSAATDTKTIVDANNLATTKLLDADRIKTQAILDDNRTKSAAILGDANDKATDVASGFKNTLTQV